jgi:hypothetical protein
MRLVEIDEKLADQILIEGLIDSMVKKVGDKLDSVITVVNNAQAAMVVLVRVFRNPEYLETMTFLMKKQINASLKYLRENPLLTKIVEGIVRFFPKGRGIKDFLMSCILVAVCNAITGMMDRIKQIPFEKVTDFLKNVGEKMMGLDSMVGRIADFSGITTVLSWLELGNELLFATLDGVNEKMKTIPA